MIRTDFKKVNKTKNRVISNENRRLTYDDLSPSVKEAIEDARLGRNLIGPFNNADEMFRYVLGEDYDLHD